MAKMINKYNRLGALGWGSMVRQLSSLLLAVLLVQAFALTGCASLLGRADKAYAKAEWKDAANLYDQAVKESRDWSADRYTRAARSAIWVGNLSKAEIFYVMAMRVGGLAEARELAEFYLRTSNYGNAVKVYDEMLGRHRGNAQLYNNMGAALMYAGRPFEAEPYLLIASEMGDRAAASLNLAILYDRYFKQGRRAVGYYRDYCRLAEGSPQESRIRQRISEIMGERFQ